jgi:hypothetical protein
MPGVRSRNICPISSSEGSSSTKRSEIVMGCKSGTFGIIAAGMLVISEIVAQFPIPDVLTVSPLTLMRLLCRTVGIMVVFPGFFPAIGVDLLTGCMIMVRVIGFFIRVTGRTGALHF